MIPSGTRFIGISETVNLTERRSAIINAETQPYTINDIRGYKVYTALLSQSGGDDPQTIDSGNLTIGVTYFINGTVPGWDFTNVGAPNNNDGTYFVATGTTPNSWGEATAGNYLRYNTGVPVATVLENTIGNVWFSYGGVGQYRAISTNNFPELKTYLYIQPKTTPDEGSITTYYSGVDSIQITTLSAIPYIEADNKLYNTSFEIRVYN